MDSTTGTDRNVVLGAAGGTLQVANSGDTLAVNGSVSGSGGLTKSGPGTLLLGNSGNSYAGGTAIAAGTLQIAADGALGTGGVIFTGNGTLQATGGFTLGAARTVDINQGFTATVDTHANDVTLAGQIAGRGNLTKTGSGTLTLTNTNTFSGMALVAGGTLTLGSSWALEESTLDTTGSGTVSFGSLIAATLGGLQGNGSLALANAPVPGRIPERRQ